MNFKKDNPVSLRLKSPKSSKSTVNRSKIIQRLWITADAQVCEIEKRLLSLDPDAAQFERDARALGLLAKFLKELVGIEGLMDESKALSKTKNADIEDDDAPPRDLEEFRKELEKRLNAMRNERYVKGSDSDA